MPFAKHNLSEHMDPEESYWVHDAMPDAVFADIGRFLIACVNIEGQAHAALRSCLDLDDHTARAVIGQPRLDDILDTLSRLCAIRGLGQEESLLLAEVKRAAKYIFKVRGIVAHQVPAWRTGWLRYDKHQTARDTSLREALLYVLQIEELQNLSEYGGLVATGLDVAVRDNAKDHMKPRACLDLLCNFVETHLLPENPAELSQRVMQENARKRSPQP